MSFVGNRPYLPREKDEMKPYYNNIIKTKPGLTGLWAVSGRSNLTFKDRLKIESSYSEKLSLKLDIKIFFKTFAVVFKGL
jgi:undecaprenyl-phosphate galactose phosphotransferase